MGRDSAIEWTDHTFNPWWGCTRISPGCDNCYAETWARRVGLKLWGKNSARRTFTDKHWDEPRKWNAASDNEDRKRVFCASMADVFEDRDELNEVRERLWRTIRETQNLDWLLLTKRPHNIQQMVNWKDWPQNVWIGTTVEDQKRAEIRLPHLLSIPAARRFLSCEPLLGSLDLREWATNANGKFFPIDWVIAGGESGAHARPMLPTWARSLRDQCKAARIPFHFKQWGHWAPVEMPRGDRSAKAFWDNVTRREVFMAPLGKKGSGRDLDGEKYDEVPNSVVLSV